MTAIFVWAILSHRWQHRRFAYTVTWVIPRIMMLNTCNIRAAPPSQPFWPHEGYDITMAMTSQWLQPHGSSDRRLAATSGQLGLHNGYDLTRATASQCLPCPASYEFRQLWLHSYDFMSSMRSQGDRNFLTTF